MSLERLAMSQYRFDLYTNHEGLQHVIGLPKGFDLAPDETGRIRLGFQSRSRRR
jgi:hypothetical protein